MLLRLLFTKFHTFTIHVFLRLQSRGGWNQLTCVRGGIRVGMQPAARVNTDRLFLTEKSQSGEERALKYPF